MRRSIADWTFKLLLLCFALVESQRGVRQVLIAVPAIFVGELAARLSNALDLFQVSLT